MKTIIPTGKWLWFWRLHLAAFVLLYVIALQAFVSLPDDGGMAVQFDIFSVLILLLMVLLVGGSVAGEAGYVFQRSMSTRGFWRALFVIFAILWIFGVAIAIVLGFYVEPRGGQAPAFAEWVEWAISAGNLCALWLYAYRSPHLWTESQQAEQVSS